MNCPVLIESTAEVNFFLSTNYRVDINVPMLLWILDHGGNYIHIFFFIWVISPCSATEKLHEPECMAGWNQTGVKEFLLVGLTENPNLQIPLFFLFSLIYSITLAGNWGMIILIWLNTQLHTPMYFFLSNLSFCDICYSTVFAPKMLVNFLSKHKASTFSGCVLQSFFFAVYVTTEGILLSMMAYDRYVAIANPLSYTLIMTQKVCIQMVLVSYLGGLINSLTHTIGLLKLDFCGPNIVNHYFCDIPPLLRLSCSDAHNNEMLLLVFSGVIAMFTFTIIMVSYTCIIIAIQRIRSAEGRHKAFSTCASHLTAVTLFYGSVTFSYIQPSSQYSLEQEKVSAVFYTLVIPMLNPLIYSLRNKDVKEAAKRSMWWKRTPTWHNLGGGFVDLTLNW